IGRGRRRPRPPHRLRLCAVPLCRGQFRFDRADWVAGPGNRRLLHRLLRAQHRRRRPVRIRQPGRPQNRRGGLVQCGAGQQPDRRYQVRRHSYARRGGADGRSVARPDETGPQRASEEPGQMSAILSRRTLLGAGAGLAAASVAGTAEGRILPKDMEPLIGPGYRAVDQDEKGLWQLMDRVEEEVSGSNLLIKDPALTGYLGTLIGNVGGPAARDMRIYLARIPEFNAMMFPTGFAVVFSGLLSRMRNEAQRAGVVAHESSHFLRKHQLRQWRDMKRKTDAFSFLAMGAGLAGGVTGTYFGDLYQLAQLGTILSL